MMRAAVLHSGRFSVGDVPEPSLRPGQVRLRVIACGICGSDLSTAAHPHQFRQAVDDADYSLYNFDPDGPLVLGHEFAGEVIEVGESVGNVAQGDVVAGYGVVRDENDVVRLIGYSPLPGGFAERVVVEASAVWAIPKGLDPVVATLAEPLGVGEASAQRAGIQQGQSAVVIGAGPIGLGAIVALRARGIEHIVAVDPSPRRRRTAEQLGATAALTPEEKFAQQTLIGSGMSDGVVAFCCVGVPGVLGRLMYDLPRGSTIMVDGSCMVDDPIRPVVGHWKGLVMNFGQGEAVDVFPITLGRLADGFIDGRALITAEVGLSEVGAAFTALADPEQHVKIVVRPDAVA